MVTIEQLEDWKKSAYAQAIKIVKRAELAEEISQDVLLEILEKKHESPYIKYLTIDAVRRRFGSPGSNRNERGGFELFDRYGTQGEHAREIERYPSQDQELTGTNEVNRIDLDRFKSYLSPKQIKLFEALRKGYTLSDYAKECGVSAASASQMFSRSCKNIKAKNLYIKPPKSRSKRNKPRRGKFVLDTQEVITIPLGKTLHEIERQYVLAVLKACLDNRTHASEVLGISLRGLRYKLQSYGIAEPKQIKTRGYGKIRQKNIDEIIKRVIEELQPFVQKTSAYLDDIKS